MEYLKLIDEYREEMMKVLQELIEIKSVQEKSIVEFPFGKARTEAFTYLLGKGEREGFEIENSNNGAGHIEFGGYTLDEEGEIVGTSDEIMGILTHLNVIPVVAALYAMKALKDSGYIPEQKVRLIIGLDEETETKGMERYLAKAKAPTFGFTPEAWYPVANGEKGIIVFQLAKKIGKTTGKGVELRSLKGGTSTETVPDYARAVIRSDKMDVYESIKNLAAAYRKEKCDSEEQQAYGAKINCKGIGKSLEITAQGLEAHGATPECGINAITVLMDFLGRLDMINDDINEFIRFYNKHIGFELDGTSFGCGLSDEVSGKLVFNVGEIELDKEAMMLGVSARIPVSVEGKAVYDGMQEYINKYNLGIIKLKFQPAVYTSPEEPFVKTLIDTYREHTGDYDSKTMVIGGATYARLLSNIVAFGPNLPEQSYGAHKNSEGIEGEELVLNAKIFADAIYRLTH